jgi:nitroimidazol reductase NimA-like FMN-containing flavoprotein (pyridoxamine 5'-phosphate oxidase superfamily)
LLLICLENDSEGSCVEMNKCVFDSAYSSIIGTQPSTVDTLRPENNKENLLREGWLHCKITLVDGKVINFISKRNSNVRFEIYEISELLITTIKKFGK